MEDGLRSPEQVALRERSFLRQQDPGPVSLGEACISAAPCLENRNHIKYCETLHVFRIVQSQAVGDAPSAVVTDQREGWKAELVHHFDKFFSHCALRIRKMVVRRRGYPAAAVGPQG